MQIIVCCKEERKAELFSTSNTNDISIQYITELNPQQTLPKADAVIDLLFSNEKDRVRQLKTMAGLVIVDSVIETLEEIDPLFIRLNGWPGFLNASLIEASCLDQSRRENASALFKKLGKELEWLPDEAGFISPRVISMIVNEAYFALAEGVSTRQNIDTAMKLGTAYPYGPFEWAKLIGLDKIAALLNRLSAQDSRYAPAALLLEEASGIKK